MIDDRKEEQVYGCKFVTSLFSQVKQLIKCKFRQKEDDQYQTITLQKNENIFFFFLFYNDYKCNCV